MIGGLAMKTPSRQNISHDDDDDVKIIITSPASSTSQHILDPSGNRIGEVELNTFENFAFGSESFSTCIDRIVWGKEDTSLLLEKHEVYITQVGPRKRFQSKKHMWNQIANDIYAKFKVIITGGQCENRYKTVLKRRKQLENTSKPNNSRSTDDDDKTPAAEEPIELERMQNEGIQINFERLEQTNQELTQQIEQFNIRVITMVERLEKHHSRQHQKFEKVIQENKDQLKTDFTTLLEKLDKIHDAIQQNQERQQHLFEELMKERQKERKAEFATLLDVLDKIHTTIKEDDKERCYSRSHRKSSRGRSPHSPPRKKHQSSISRSRSNSKCNHKTSNSKRSKSNDRYNTGSRSTNTRNTQHSPYSSRMTKWDRRHKSKSRSPKGCNHRSCQDSFCKQQDKYR